MSAKLPVLLYGVFAYVFFLGTFLYAIWFVWTLDRPQPPPESLLRNLLINAGLLALFAVQHSVMARPGFKRVWTRLVPPVIERSTYVVAASAALLLLIVAWQPLPAEIWNVGNPIGQRLLHVLFWAGWGMVLGTTFLIDHGELFGLKQVMNYWKGQPTSSAPFVTPGPYKFVRHPLYFGFLMAFWSTPVMTAGHLFFAVMCTAYILVAIQLEERDLITYYGDVYRRYRQQVSMLIPWPSKWKSS